ncbi:MAG: hypothetical protein ACR2NG_04425 [Acidimicrobiia bacterium]
MRRVMAGFGVAVLLSGCGGGALTLTEYVDHLNAINGQLNPQAEALISDLERSATPREISVTMEGVAALRIESVQASEALEPPEQVADLHQLVLGWEKRLLPIEQALAARAGSVADWEELFRSDEVVAYRTALVEGKHVCIEFQAQLDATADRGVFADTPWIPSAMSEVVSARLGCELFPENPQDVFQPTPPATVPEASG